MKIAWLPFESQYMAMCRTTRAISLGLEDTQSLSPSSAEHKTILGQCHPSVTHVKTVLSPRQP